MLVQTADAALGLLARSPPRLQERFIECFMSLQDWEQTLLLASLQRIAAMMDAEDIDAAPVLSSGSVRASTEAVGAALEPDATAAGRSPGPAGTDDRRPHRAATLPTLLGRGAPLQRTV